MPELLIALGAGATALLAIGTVIQKWVRPFFQRVSNFLDDWNGAPARPGRAAVPGIPERLSGIEQEQARSASEIVAVKARQDATDASVATLAQAFGAVVGREQTARIEAHREGQQMWQAVQQVASTDEPEQQKRGA